MTDLPLQKFEGPQAEERFRSDAEWEHVEAVELLDLIKAEKAAKEAVEDERE